jgi:Tfp pilus assembly protein PilF
MDEEHRKQYVAVLLEAAAPKTSTAEALQAAVATEAERQAAAARAAEHARLQDERVRRLRERFDPLALRRRKATEHYEMGLAAREAGDMGKAANSFRIAMELDPSRGDLHELWQSCLGVARSSRAEVAFRSAQRLIETGRAAEAVPHLVEAADANPTAEHLAHAAEALAGTDPTRSRDLALRALDALAAADAMGTKKTPHDRAGLHLRLARAFLAAGQTRTAAQQLEEVLRHQPDHPDAHVLLKTVRLT